MSLQRRGLCALLADRNKEPTVKGASGSQLSISSIPPAPVVNPFVVPPLKKKRKDKDVSEEGKVVLQKDPKQQKMAKGKERASSIKNKGDHIMAEVRPPNPIWEPQIELDRVVIIKNSSIREFKKGHAFYLVETLEQPLLLPKDMEALRNMR